MVDLKGLGPNPRGQQVYAPRLTYRLQVSTNGSAFAPLLDGTFGPKYAVANFPAVTARKVRLVFTDLDVTSAFDTSPTFGAAEIYLFDTGPSPRLTASLTDGSVTLQWPTNAAGYLLESALELGPDADWSLATEPSEIVNDQHTVVVTPAQARRFFRLTRQ